VVKNCRRVKEQKSERADRDKNETWMATQITTDETADDGLDSTSLTYTKA